MEKIRVKIRRERNVKLQRKIVNTENTRVGRLGKYTE
jgi:hypothetical protein